MRFAIIADIHGNLEALQVVLQDIKQQGCTHYACLGDVVGYGASPNEVVAELQRVGATGVMGNHDLAALGDDVIDTFNEAAHAAALWTRDVLTAESRGWLRALPKVLEMGAATIVHASLRDPILEYVVQGEVAEANLRALHTPLLFHGHTHTPAHWTLRAGRATSVAIDGAAQPLHAPSLVNLGSVGQPRDGDPRAGFAVVDTGRREVTIYRVDYPIAQAQARIAGVVDGNANLTGKPFGAWTVQLPATIAPTPSFSATRAA